MKKVAVFLPTDATVAQIADLTGFLGMLVRCQQQLGVEFVFGLPENLPLCEELRRHSEFSVCWRPMSWELGIETDYFKIFKMRRLGRDICRRPIDHGGYDFLDCDVWIAVDPNEVPIAPIRPLAIVRTMCWERFMSGSDWQQLGVDGRQYMHHIAAFTRETPFLFAVGSQVREQWACLAGIARETIHELPIVFNQRTWSTLLAAEKTTPLDSTIVWFLDDLFGLRHIDTSLALSKILQELDDATMVVVLPKPLDKLENTVWFIEVRKYLNEHSSRVRWEVDSARFRAALMGWRGVIVADSPGRLVGLWSLCVEPGNVFMVRPAQYSHAWPNGAGRVLPMGQDWEFAFLEHFSRLGSNGDANSVPRSALDAPESNETQLQGYLAALRKVPI